MNRPLRGPQNPTPVDHATDTYDTIDWLVKNIPESNGKVGILGISYDGFLPLMALVNPHPALKVSVPMNPMVDGWMGDDWFHNGAFRQQNMPYIYEQEAHARQRRRSGGPATSTTTTCSCRPDRPASSAAGAASSRSASGARSSSIRPTTRSGATRRWTRCSRAQPLTVPVMLVHSLWDQEDIYGAIAVYKAIKPKDTAQRQGVPGDGPVASRPGDRRRQHARRAEVRQRHGALLPPRDPAAVPRSVPEGRRAEGRRRAGDGVRDRHEHVAAAAGVAGRLRERLQRSSRRRSTSAPACKPASPRRRPATRRSTSTSPIRRSRCRSARGRSSRSATTTA